MDARDPTEGTGPDPGLISLLAFWADAGVEVAYEEAPVDRLARLPEARSEATPRPAAAPVPASRATAGASAALEGEIERARAAALAAPDLAALETALRAFLTPLKPRNAAVVFARGVSVDPAVIVIGQGPSPEDEAEGLPFGGRAGRLLDRMLAAAGLEARALILNTGFWRPGPRGSQPELEAVCAPLLERAIALARPRALLLAGEGALRALTGPGEPIASARGRWRAWTPAGAADAEPLPALPIFHPDFLLRHPAAKKRAWADLLSLADRLAAP